MEVSSEVLLYPFEGVTPPWECFDMGYESRPISIVCSEYEEVGVPKPCAHNTYDATGTGIDGYCVNSCPPDRPVGLPGATSIVDCRAGDECVQIAVDGCVGMDVEPLVSRTYDKYDGDCGGSTAFHEPWTDTFVYYIENQVEVSLGFGYTSRVEDANWSIGKSCGSAGDAYAQGMAGSYPFLDASLNWFCVHWIGNAEAKPLSVECTMFEGQQATCRIGTYNESSVGPEGKCFSCPANKPMSLPGSVKASDCITVATNLFVAHDAQTRITSFNGVEEQFKSVTEGGNLDKPRAIEFLNNTVVFVANYGSGTVNRIDVEGEALGTFAVIEAPSAMHFDRDVNVLVVASSSMETESTNGLYFFRLDDYEERGTLDFKNSSDFDFVDTTVGSFSNAYTAGISPGLEDGEIIYDDGTDVFRTCIPDHPTCDPAASNRKLLRTSSILALQTLRADGSYLVVDGFFGVDVMVYKCPFEYKIVTECSVFANEPEGVPWDPVSLAVDDSKELVYIGNDDDFGVLVFHFDGTFLGRVSSLNGDLSGTPTSMAVNQGVTFPVLSTVHTPSPPFFADTAITFNVTLRASDDNPLPASYDVSAELHLYHAEAESVDSEGRTMKVRAKVLSTSPQDRDVSAKLQLLCYLSHLGSLCSRKEGASAATP
jgi:DNA-binding beta-propeller fold protein YncE